MFFPIRVITNLAIDFAAVKNSEIDPVPATGWTPTTPTHPTAATKIMKNSRIDPVPPTGRPQHSLSRVAL